MKLINCRKAYGDKVVFDNITYEFKNKIYWLQGVNGIGKSVLFRCISGIEKFTSGTRAAHIKNILYIPEFSLNEDWLTIKENVRLLALYHKLNMHENQISEILECLNLGKGDVLPAKASVGMNMKTAFALTFVASHWDLIIIDEAISHIDQQSRGLIFSELLKRCQENSIVLFSYHGNLPGIDYDDQVYQRHDVQPLILRKEGLFHE